MKTLVLKLESAMPAVDRPVSGVDGRKVEQGGVCSLSTMARSPAATLPSFISFTRNTALQQKRTIKGDLQYIQTIEGTQFPKD